MREHAGAYAAARGIEIAERLGWGIHASVWKITGKEGCSNCTGTPLPGAERVTVYRRLRELETSSIEGVHLPQLIRDDEDWLAIEMTRVKRPFLLDFGAAWRDEPPDFPPGVWEQAE